MIKNIYDKGLNILDNMKIYRFVGEGIEISNIGLSINHIIEDWKKGMMNMI